MTSKTIETIGKVVALCRGRRVKETMCDGVDYQFAFKFSSAEQADGVLHKLQERGVNVTKSATDNEDDVEVLYFSVEKLERTREGSPRCREGLGLPSRVVSWSVRVLRTGLDSK